MIRALAPLGDHTHEPRRSWPSWRGWLVFGLQAILVVLVDASNDIIRGNLQPPNATEALQHAQQVAAFESAHDLFIEPAVQETMRHTHNVLGFLLTWPDIIQFANSMYAFGHIFITLAVAAWLYVDHRAGFRMVRNVMLITNAAAFALYELYPLAPPRLTSGLRYDGRAFHFQDTMGHVLGTGTLNGTPIAYNPFSAMPSIHVAWALIIGISLVILARHAVLKALGALYPLIMTFAVLVTANHYVLDAIGAAAVVLLAGAIVFGTEQIRSRLRQRTGSLHEPPAISPPILKSA